MKIFLEKREIEIIALEELKRIFPNRLFEINNTFLRREFDKQWVEAFIFIKKPAGKKK